MTSGTRRFEGTYTARDGHQQKLNVKIFQRFGLFVLSGTLVGSLVGHISNSKDVPKTETVSIEDSYIKTDAELVERATDMRTMLNDIAITEYEVKFGDTLSSIAEACGNTVYRLCALNGINEKDILQTGQKLQIETICEKNPVDAEIACLESYFYDYLFNSEISRVAKSARDGSGKHEDMAEFYYASLYGKDYALGKADPGSIYGGYTYGYIEYHNKNEHTDEEKNAYFALLSSLADIVDRDLNLSGKASNVVSYDDFKNLAVQKAQNLLGKNIYAKY